MFKRFFSISIVLSLAVLLAGIAIGQEPEKRISDMRNDGSSVSWRILVPHKSVTLTVSAPDGSVFRREFRSGATPVFSPFNKNGESFSDGTFTYQLVITPEISPDIKEQLTAAREKGESDALAADFRRRGVLPYITSESGSFGFNGGQIVTANDLVEESENFSSDGGTVEPDTKTPDTKTTISNAGDVPTDNVTVINMDLVVLGSECIGLDCPNNPSFGFDTLRLQENNLRIDFLDTSSTASFPSNDWKIEINDTTNGGQNRFSVRDVTAGRSPFTIEAAAAVNSLYVDSTSRIGFKTATPVVELHVRDGDTPTLRLEQDGSSGFTAQTFDIAGNEANFFVRDVTNGSRLVFKIKPGAPTSSLFVANDGDVCLSCEAPNGEAQLHVNSNGTNREVVHLQRAGNVGIVFNDTNDTNDWSIGTTNPFEFSIAKVGTGTVLEARTNGDVSIPGGNLFVGGTMVNVPDYVFEKNYSLMSIDEVREFIAKNGHLPGVTSAKEVSEAGELNMTKMQMQLLKKIEELTLYTIQQQQALDVREQETRQLKGEVEALKKLVKSFIDK